MEEKHPLNVSIGKIHSRGYAATGCADLLTRLSAQAALGQGKAIPEFAHRSVVMLGGAGWGGVGTIMTDASLRDCLAVFGPLRASPHDVGSSMVLAALQGLQRFSAMRVGDGAEAPALCAFNGFSPTVAKRIAWHLRGGLSWVCGESDGGALVLTARFPGTLGNELSLRIERERGGAGSILSICLAGRILESVAFPEAMPPGQYALSGGRDGDAGLDGRLLQQAAGDLLMRDLLPSGAVVALPGDAYCAGWPDLAAALADRGAGLAAVLPFDRAVPFSWAADLAEHLHDIGRGMSCLLWADDLYWNDPGGCGVGLVSPVGALAAAMALNVREMPLRGILGPRHAMAGGNGFETLGSGANGNEFEKVAPSVPGFRIITPDKSREIYCVKLT